MPGQIRIGIAGWTYAGWRGVFYPKGLPHKRELAYAADRFRSIEINGTFYRMQRPENFARWNEETPRDFVFAIKGSRYITHLKRLKDIETPLANFFSSGLLRLGEKLGPVLWQFPARMKFDRPLFEHFLSLLPKDTAQTLRLARNHDTRVDGRAWLKAEKDRSLRHAVEIRNESFCCPEFIHMLRHFGVGLVVADTVDWPCLMDMTSDFVYCRLHGSEELYASGYDDVALDRWAERVRAWTCGREPEDAKRVLDPSRPARPGRDVYIYFDNDKKVRAPFDAIGLAKRLGLAPEAVEM